MVAKVILKKSREKSLLRRHPWVFSNGIERVEGHAELGDTVEVYAKDGRWLGRGAYSPQSQIRVRIWTFDQNEAVDLDFFASRIARAQLGREYLIERDGLTGYRLIAGESDGLPGITIDRFADVLVCQLLSAGAEAHRDTLVEALKAQFPQCAIYERSDVDVRKKEGLKPVAGLLHGTLPAQPMVFEENGVKLLVDVENGHKTGAYLDQRDNRLAASRYVKGQRVLNCFSYSGGFGTYALKAGAAEVVNVDVSKPALALAQQSAEINELDLSRLNNVDADVFKLLRQYREEGEQFDVIILDPPKFADNKAQLPGACRGYKDINLVAMQCLKPGGILLTYSCSGLMDSALFQKIVADAALDAGRDAQILEKLAQASDHPIGSAYPEGFYLKGLALRVW
ncbi:SAM-dependent methyltransferase; 23S rRNA m(5)C-1962 methyltransferase [Ferrimonas balearica DSM 9799]|uniref:Ribosomal RNA large subunit methyltransferase I n=1 Tax=Ferrimonas balearica (strain DSM 9799 / CCM 4581 / KCTC 23876 / PAT) TaxID=550540 RepID=E1SQN4_FERBD|nr:class I SAM-dependent methyltransferase [Ferrimonas balearica]ADN75832.1 SAM-dependent methyltransferase; 23S rRNA m(5)C-1962 methyltransferase [Ferrimonas balearica DSM 9799]